MFRTDHTGKSFESIKSPTNTSEYDDKPLLVSGSEKDALTVIASKSHNNAETDAYIAQYNVSKIINAGSSLKFCLIANGEADFYPRLGRTMEWDTAAGHAILLGAGGYVTNLSTQKALNYGKPGSENPFFMAHNSNQLKIKNTFEIFLYEVLALKNVDEKSSIDNKISSDLIELLIKIRNQSRANKNFELSDQIRDDLMSLGVQLNDDKNESSYKMI